MTDQALAGLRDAAAAVGQRGGEPVDPLDKPFALERLQIGQRGGGAHGVRRVRAGHLAGTIQAHQLLGAEHGGQRHAAGDPLAAGDQIGDDAQMLEAEQPAGAAEPGLNLIQDQDGAVLVAPAAEGLGVVCGEKRRVAALERFANDAADAVRIDAESAQAPLEDGERDVGLAETVGERNLDEPRIGPEPALERRRAARKLGAHRAPVEVIVEADDDVLVLVADRAAPRHRQLEAAFDRLGPGRQQEDARQRRGQQRLNLFRQLQPDFGREAIGMVEALIGHPADRIQNRGVAVTGSGHQHAAGKIDPLVAPRVLHERARAAMPDHRRLAAHAARLDLPHLLEQRNRFGHRQRRDDPAASGFDPVDLDRFEREFLGGHGGRSFTS
ncbi:MAG: hypothetical protein BWZ08_00086 [candidate division BRC1 bacterium ADurb.BinA292]|nr:MAG: hypothetical protein BWZ08_00086 [candidate division BRC1 bacterium ADurb.BinA292]